MKFLKIHFRDMENWAWRAKPTRLGTNTVQNGTVMSQWESWKKVICHSVSILGLHEFIFEAFRFSLNLLRKTYNMSGKWTP